MMLMNAEERSIPQEILSFSNKSVILYILVNIYFLHLEAITDSVFWTLIFLWIWVKLFKVSGRIIAKVVAYAVF